MYRSRLHKINENGDLESNFIDGSLPDFWWEKYRLLISPIVTKTEGLIVDDVRRLWTRPLKLPYNASVVSNGNYFRLIEKVRL